VSSLLTSDMRAWARGLAGRIGQAVPRVAATRRRRLLLVHLDGVPKALLDEGVRTGRMPFLSTLVRSGAYQLEEAFWGSPASTPCFEAGLLYGIPHPNLPAYSWFDRELGRRVRMNAPQDALDIEQRLERTRSPQLFAEGGHTYFTLFRGGARNQLCMSTLSSLKGMARALPSEMEGLRAARTRHPLRYLGSLAWESGRALREIWRWGRALGDFRHEAGFLISRVLLQQLGWSFAHTKALVDMVRGVPSVYLVFGNYDEVAHRRGPRSAQAVAELERVDGYLAELYAMARTVEHPYDVVFLTDHGHVESLPFEQRQGQRLEDMLVRGAPASLPEAVSGGLLDGRGPLPPLERPAPEAPVVVESGNFAHVYLTRARQPLEARALVAHHPEVLARAARHPDIGLVAVRRGDSAVALVKGQVYRADELERAPLAGEFSRRAVADYLRELPFMPTAGDLVLFGEAVRPGATVGFAWEFGSHGGLTRTETCSTVCWPSEGPVELSGLTHCVNLHQRLAEAYLD
jgi:uncharacterized protein with GYD domain